MASKTMTEFLNLPLSYSCCQYQPQRLLPLDEWCCDGQSIPAYVEALEQRLLMSADPVAWALSAASPVQFTDNSGDLVTIRVNGTATGTVYTPAGGVNGFNGNAVLIDLIDAGPMTKLKITTPKGTTTMVGDITVHGAMASLTATTTTLTGTMTVDGALSSAAFADLAGATIDVDGKLSKLTVTGSAVNSTVRATDDLKWVGVGSAIDSNFLAGIVDGADAPTMTRQFTGSSVKSFSITGKTGVFTDSVVAAQTLGSISLRNASGDDAAIVARDAAGKEIKSLTSRNTTTRKTSRYVEGSAFAVAVNLVSTDGLAPVASATTGLAATEGDIVGLDALASSDPDGQTLSYQWTQTGGPAVTFADATSARPSFTAPSVTDDTDTQLTFSVTVTDTDGMSSTFSPVVVTVSDAAVVSTMFLQGNVPTTYPSGYALSQSFSTPLALTVVPQGSESRTQFGQVLAAGWYDFATMPIGDNFVVARGGAYTQVYLNGWSTPSIRPRFAVNENSAGFLITMRGPYASSSTPEASRGDWHVGGNQYGQDAYGSRLSAQVYSHAGARYDRYYRNGYQWCGDFLGHPLLSDTYWGAANATALGPKKADGSGYTTVSASSTGPDVTLDSSVLNQTVYVSLAFVDCFGRETTKSTPLAVDYIHSWSSTAGTVIDVKRDYPLPYGCVGVYIYAGYSSGSMTRQPVLDYQGSTPQYLWPWDLTQYPLQQITTNGGTNDPSATVASVLSPEQQALEDGDTVISYTATTHELYCPFLLPYTADYYGIISRVIGSPTTKCTFTQQTTLDSYPLVTAYPLMAFQNQMDTVYNASFIGASAPWGIVSSDWSGGQAMNNNRFINCGWNAGGADSVGCLIDARSCGINSHTQSETRYDGCSFVATVPVQIEGAQTAMIRFVNGCQFYSVGSARYAADTAGLIYAGTSNNVQLDVQGAGGSFRSLVVVNGEGGEASIIVNDLFEDQGCPVFVTFYGNAGGKVTFQNGERINLGSATWQRLCEAPIAFHAQVKMSNVTVTPGTTSISYLLNQLNVDVDFSTLVVQPTQAYWQGTLGLALRSDQGFDWTNTYTPVLTSITSADVTGGNQTPTDIALSPSTIAEDEPSGTTVGTFSTTDPDAGNTFTYTLVSGTGSADNGSFTIAGNTLLTAAIFNYDSKSSYNIRVRTTDQGGLWTEKPFTITVTNGNQTPTDIALSLSTIAENKTSGTTVGTFSTTDPDAGNTFTYTLVSGAGSTDNGSFTISGSTLRTAAIFNYEGKSSYSIRVRTTDQGGLWTEKPFTITVTNVNETPTDIALSPSTIAENMPSGTTVGTFSTTDPDAGNTFTYALVSGTGSTDNGSFTISGSTLRTAAVFNYESKSSYSIRVRTTDQGGLRYTKVFTITVTDVNESPTDIVLSSVSVPEQCQIGTVIGALSGTDPDIGQSATLTFSIVPDQGDYLQFSIDPTTKQLKTAAIFNYEIKNSYSIKIRATDTGTVPLTYDKTFTISVLDEPELPGDANSDGKVNFSDYLILEQHFGIIGTGTLAQGDFNNDTNVNFSDYLILEQNFNTVFVP